MTEYSEVMKDFKAFILGKTPEERKVILNLIEEWTESLILEGIRNVEKEI